MNTDVEPVTEQTGDRNSTEPSELNSRVAAILSRGQKKRPGGISTFLIALTSAVLLWSSFTPLDWGPLAWIALVPLLCLVRPADPPAWLYRSLYLVGFLYWLATLQWMRLGDPTMYLALIALSAYLGCYWPLWIWLCRVTIHRSPIPLLIAAPVYFAGLEYLRAYLFTGFAWYYLGHTQYRWVNAIQIADLVGVYGISFVIVLGNVALAQLVPARWLIRRGLCWPGEEDRMFTWSRRQQAIGVGVSAALIVAVTGYGMARRGGGDFPLGPRVALIQGNFVASVQNNTDDPREIFLMHRQLSGLTVADSPDLVVWPESMFPYGVYEVEEGVTDAMLEAIAPEVPAHIWRGKESDKALTDLADMTRAALVIGASTFVAGPASYAIYNSAVFVQPDIGLTGRYDKIHRVPFGEYIPLRDVIPFLQSLTPFRGKFGIDRGTKAEVFRFRDWDFIPLICFEDTVPQLVRTLARAGGVNSAQQNQVLVNLTNDGWFHGSSELDQHLITSQFRAIETRTPLIRAVNTGISAVIDGDGVVREALKFYDAGPRDDIDAPLRESMRDPHTGRFHKQLNCAIVADVPLDPRTSLYTFWGDWFAAGCLIATVAMGLREAVLRPRAKSRGPAT